MLKENRVLIRDNNNGKNWIYKIDNNYQKNFISQLRIDTLKTRAIDTILPVVKFLPNDSMYILNNYEENSLYEFYHIKKGLLNKKNITGDYANIKISPSGQYFFLTAKSRDVDLYRTKDFNKLLSVKTNYDNLDIPSENVIQFIEQGDTLCAVITKGKILIFNNQYKAIDSMRINSMVTPNEYFTAFNDKYFFALIPQDKKNTWWGEQNGVLYNFRTKDSLVLFRKKYYKNPLITNKNSIICFDRPSRNLLVLDKTGILIKKIPVKGQEFTKIFIDNNTVVLISSNSYQYFDWNSRGCLMKSLLPQSYIETFNITTGKKVYSFIENENSFDNIFSSFQKNRLVTADGYKYFDGTKILDNKCQAMNELVSSTNISPNNKFIIFPEKKLLKMRIMSIVPEDIVRRVKVVKEFGEIRDFTEYERREFGVE